MKTNFTILAIILIGTIAQQAYSQNKMLLSYDKDEKKFTHAIPVDLKTLTAKKELELTVDLIPDSTKLQVKVGGATINRANGKYILPKADSGYVLKVSYQGAKTFSTPIEAREETVEAVIDPKTTTENKSIEPPYWFLPNAKDYAKFDSIKLISRPSTASADEKEYRLIYDYRTTKLDYPKAKLRGSKKVTSINSNIVFEVKNVNPFIHTVTIDDRPVNLNTELAGDFAKFLAIPSSAQDTGEASAQGVGTKDAKVDTIERLLGELELFYKQKLGDPYPDMDLYIRELSFIYTQIDSKFSLNPDANKKTELLAKGKEMMKDLNDANKKKYEVALLKAADILDKLGKVNYSITSGVLTPGNNDELDIDLTIKKGEQILLPKKTYNVYLSGGFKADFSIGFYLSGLQDELYTLKSENTTDTSFFIDEYFVKTDSILDIDTVQKQKIIRDDTGKDDIGMMIMGHFYPRTGYRFNIAATAGFGIDTDHSARYLLGGSILWGYEKRFCFTYGMIWGKRKALASSLQEGQYYDGNADQLQKDVKDHSWFAGISFNIGSIPADGGKKK